MRRQTNSAQEFWPLFSASNTSWINQRFVGQGWRYYNRIPSLTSLDETTTTPQPRSSPKMRVKKLLQYRNLLVIQEVEQTPSGREAARTDVVPGSISTFPLGKSHSEHNDVFTTSKLPTYACETNACWSYLFVLSAWCRSCARKKLLHLYCTIFPVAPLHMTPLRKCYIYHKMVGAAWGSRVQLICSVINKGVHVSQLPPVCGRWWTYFLASLKLSLSTLLGKEPFLSS